MDCEKTGRAYSSPRVSRLKAIASKMRSPGERGLDFLGEKRMNVWQDILIVFPEDLIRKLF